MKYNFFLLQKFKIKKILLFFNYKIKKKLLKNTKILKWAPRQR